MVGGELESVQWAYPFWKAYANKIFHVGSLVGTGMLLKLCNNVVLQSNRLALYEGINLACTAGININTFIDVLHMSSGGSWVVDHWEDLDARAWQEGLGDHQLVLQLEKDLDAALGLAENLGVHLNIAQLARQELPNVLRTGHMGRSFMNIPPDSADSELEKET